MFRQGIIENPGISLGGRVAAVYGYFLGGYNTSGTVIATSDRKTFSTGATAARTAANLSSARRYGGQVTDATTYGYSVGGTTTNGSAPVVTGDRITFSTGATAANTASNLTAAKFAMPGITDYLEGAIYGYFAGGYTGDHVATTDRITFSLGVTAAATASSLTVAKNAHSGLSDGATYGYLIGGAGGSGIVATTDRMTFSNGVCAANTASNLSGIRQNSVGISDCSVYGYVLGGTTNLTNANVLADRILYSSGVMSAQTSANLTTAKSRHGGLTDGLVYGYASGGWTNTDYTTGVNTEMRVTFSSSTTAAYTSSTLSVARSNIPAGISDTAF